MYNVKAAVGRLPFAPDTDEMDVTDIRTGHFVFPPLPDEPVSLARLEEAITGAGYEIERAWLEVTGTLQRDGRLRVPGTGQVFGLAGGDSLDRLKTELQQQATVSIFGEWLAGEELDTLVVQNWMRGEAPVERPDEGADGQGGG